MNTICGQKVRFHCSCDPLGQNSSVAPWSIFENTFSNTAFILVFLSQRGLGGIRRRVIGEGNSNPLQYSCLENPMDGGAWWAAVHGVSKSGTGLSDFTFDFHTLEREMATHSSVLAWRIPGTGEPGGLPSMGLHRVRRTQLKRLSSSIPDTGFQDGAP